MDDVLGDSEEFAIVSSYELLESSNIPIFAGMDKDKIKVIACHWPHCELCRVCRHIHSSRFEEQPLCGNNRCCVEMDSRFRCNAIWKSESHCTTTWPVIFGWTEQK
jgi:hypothetical protein